MNSQNKEEIIIIKCEDGEVHIGPLCPPLKEEFVFELENKKEKENDSTS